MTQDFHISSFRRTSAYWCAFLLAAWRRDAFKTHAFFVARIITVFVHLTFPWPTPSFSFDSFYQIPSFCNFYGYRHHYHHHHHYTHRFIGFHHRVLDWRGLIGLKWRKREKEDEGRMRLPFLERPQCMDSFIYQII